MNDVIVPIHYRQPDEDARHMPPPSRTRDTVQPLLEVKYINRFHEVVMKAFLYGTKAVRFLSVSSDSRQPEGPHRYLLTELLSHLIAVHPRQT
jgi:hypothetical protein